MLADKLLWAGPQSYHLIRVDPTHNTVIPVKHLALMPASASQVSLDRPTARTTISRRLHSRSAAVQKQEMTFHTLKRQLKACSVCCTSDVLANRRNIALLWRFRDSDARYKTAYLLTYLQVEPFWREAPEWLVLIMLECFPPLRALCFCASHYPFYCAKLTLYGKVLNYPEQKALLAWTDQRVCRG